MLSNNIGQISCVAVLIISLSALLGLSQREELGFALIGTESTDTLVKMWRPLLEDMSKAIGVEVKAMAYPDYSGAIWALKTGKAKLAWLGNKSAILAVDQAQSEVAFIGAEEGGEEGYVAQLITRTDSPLMSTDDVLKNAPSLTFALGDPNSTSGYTVPAYYLFARNRIDPTIAFKRLVTGTHEENFLAVIEGRVDVVASNSFDLKRMRVKYPELFPRIRVIWNSPLIPSDPLVWRKNLPETQKAAIRSFLLQYGEARPGKKPEQLEHERAALKGLGRSAFRVSDNRQLIPIRQLELFTLKERILADPKLSNEVRKEKLKEIEELVKSLQDTAKGSTP
jgi:phosphonate transport system substrate-binding protein